MEIISFTGKSGTGKSYNAIRVSRENNIDAIIDDGLLIYKGSIVAGSSAKKCDLKAQAMRTALFNYEDQRKQVQAKLRELSPDKLLILGTSDRMADWITDALELPRATRRIYIEDVTSEEDRKIAGKSRYEDGEHVIPAPMMQLKRDFAGYFMNPIRFLKGAALPEQTSDDDQRTVVRPSYSYYGKFTISEQVIGDIIRITALDHASCLKVAEFYHNGNTGSLNVVIELRIRKTRGVMKHISVFQESVHSTIEQMTAFSISHINIKIRDIVLPREEHQPGRKRARLGGKGK